ncbi:sodium:calcium antiporter [Salibacteraceae bacterium]|nr:sodium:calcium antiporter [Salibacteraceae bacterium]
MFCCLIIWKASDGFEASSEYLGRNMTEGVRGATINAIASSMPELFTTIFFLLCLNDTEGFSGGIGTTAGSAIFNGMIIPAAVIFVVLLAGITKNITVSRKVILRDGIALILAETLLIFLISGSSLYWWHGLVLMSFYGAYMWYMLSSMKSAEPSSEEEEEDDDEDEDEDSEEVGTVKAIFTLDLEALFIGNREINSKNAWALLLTSMLVIGFACLILVRACEMIGYGAYELPFIGEVHGLDIPIMFVAVILASAATSVPDTIISMKDAKAGNYNDAISNALGSNIFDICFALGFPLFMYCIIYGPIQMSPETIQFSSELRILLLLFTVLAFFIYFTGKKMGILKALMLIGIYIFFTAYISARSMDAAWANQISEFLTGIYNLVH